jgi:hypothetical protein
MSAEPPMPIVVGVGRSGTTLVRLMLDAHPSLAIPAETHFLPALADLAFEGTDSRRRVFEVITGFETWPDLDTAVDELDAALAAVEPFDAAAGARAFYALYARRHGKTRYGDKSPPYCVEMPRIARLLPEARFIHVIRDGRDVALSVRPLWFSPGKTITEIARDWAGRIRAARAQAAARAYYLEVRFEDLVRDARTVLARICRFVDIDPHPSMERYFETARSRLSEVATRRRADGSVVITKDARLDMHRWTNEPPCPERVERWRHGMTLDERREFERAAGDLLEELGYPV